MFTYKYTHIFFKRVMFDLNINTTEVIQDEICNTTKVAQVPGRTIGTRPKRKNLQLTR